MYDGVDIHNLVDIAIVIVCMQVSFFVITWACHMEKMTDLAALINFSTVAFVSFYMGESWTVRQLVVILMVIIWGSRLSGFLLYRTIRIGDGDRFDTSTWCVHFLGFWGFQAIWVFVVSLPVIFINSPWHYYQVYNQTTNELIQNEDLIQEIGAITQNVSTSTGGMTAEGMTTGGMTTAGMTTVGEVVTEGGYMYDHYVYNETIVAHQPAFGTPWDCLGMIIYFVGVMLETFADMQKFYFKENPVNQGRWCTFGLWSWSRHPNYFGEILVWVGVFVVGISVYHRAQWFAVLSPGFITGVLLFGSGIPLIERSADMKYASNDEYRLYKENTSIIIPIAPTCYAKMPKFIKVTVLLDFSIYGKPLTETVVPDETTYIAPTKNMVTSNNTSG